VWCSALFHSILIFPETESLNCRNGSLAEHDGFDFFCDVWMLLEVRQRPKPICFALSGNAVKHFLREKPQ
jgi:hypothetical protein